MKRKLPVECKISVRAVTHARIVDGLKRNANGRIRPGALKARADKLINAALDAAERSGN